MIKKTKIVKEISSGLIIELLGNAERVKIVDDQMGIVTALTCDGQEIGRFEYSDTDFGIHITYMNLEKCERKYVHRGIGTEIVRYLEEVYGSVYFSTDDGIRRDDGSHLTEDGPAFVTHLVELGIIVDPDIGDDDEDYCGD